MVAPAVGAAVVSAILKYGPSLLRRKKTVHGEAIAPDVKLLLNRLQNPTQRQKGLNQLFGMSKDLSYGRGFSAWGDCSGWGSLCTVHRDAYRKVAQTMGIPVPAACFQGGRGPLLTQRRRAAGCRAPIVAQPVAAIPLSPTPIALNGFGSVTGGPTVAFTSTDAAWLARFY